MTQFKARPTTYKGIQMRSRLEAGFAAWLDAGKTAWSYEPRAYADETGQYLPDFELPEISFIGKPAQVFIEVKPQFPDLETLLAQHAILKASEPDSQLVAVWPDGTALMSMLIHEGTGVDIIWTIRPEGLALELQTVIGPWRGEYWKPRLKPS